MDSQQRPMVPHRGGLSFDFGERALNGGPLRWAGVQCPLGVVADTDDVGSARQYSQRTSSR